MKLVIWFVLLFAVAVVAAMSLGANDGLVSLYWRGWRLDVSLNFFILAMLGAFVALASSVRVTRWLLGLPQRARAWRESRREQALQGAQRDAIIEFVAARYSRAVKAAQRAQSLMGDLPAREGHAQTQAVNHLLAALALHRLQDRAGRDEEIRLIESTLGPSSVAPLATSASPRQGSLQEGLILLRAEWALDDRDAASALQLLEQLPPGASRRVQAQRLRMQAHRLVAEPAESLKSARLLAKHQAFKPEAARSLLRSLAMAVLDTARDLEGLQKCWLELEREDRQDITVAAHLVACAARLGGADWSRRVLRGSFESASALSAEQREELCLSLWSVARGIEPEWLALVEPLAVRHAREPAVVAVAAVVYAERQLWGKAQPLLEQTARGQAPLDVRRDAWCRLAHLALDRDDAKRAADCFRQAAELR